jgi:alpha-ribazole phosphatase/probable phosphoglycerate mutase
VPAPTTILLARHGESDWNRDVRWQGHADRPLTERGLEQARALAERLDPFSLDAIYASDLARARDTAQVVAGRRGLPVVTRIDLREVDVGSWSGFSRDELEASDPEGIQRWLDGGRGWLDGESYEEMAERVVAAVLEIAHAHPGEHVLVVCHGGCVRAIHARALGITIHAHRSTGPIEPNARLSAVVVDGDAIGGLHVP